MDNSIYENLIPSSNSKLTFNGSAPGTNTPTNTRLIIKSL